MRSIKNLLFDLDGTIIAPEEGIINSLLYAYEKLGEKPLNSEELRSFIGPPLVDSFSNYHQWSTDKVDQAIAFYREHFAEKGLYENHLYNHINEVLLSFKDQGYKLYLATSKPTVFAEKILINFHLDHLFDGITGSNLDNTRGQKTEIIAYVLNHFQLNANECVMIGDRRYDIIGANNNGVLSIGVTYGHGNEDELNQAGADYIIHDCTEIPNLIPSL